MKISPVSCVGFRANNSLKVNKSKEEDLQFKKGQKKIMHSAYVFSAVLLAGTIAYFKKIS